MKSFLSLRPFQIIIMIVFVLMAFVGLFLFASYSGTKMGSKSIGTVVIWGTVPQAAIQNELSRIVQSNKGYNNIAYVQQPLESFDTSLSSAIAAQNGPDLILISQEQLMSERNKINLITFSDSVPKRSFVDSTYLPEFSLFATNAGTYGIPYVLDPMVLYYNKTILNSSGVSVPPTSWEGIVGLASTLTKTTGGEISQATIPFGTYENLSNGRGVLSLLFLQAGSPITQSVNTGVRTVLADTSTQSTNGATPTQSVLNFYTQFSDPSRTVYSWNSNFANDRQAFIAGNLAFYVGYASELPTLQAANPNLSFDMATIPQPQTAKAAVDYGLAYAFAIPKASKNPSGALSAALALADKGYESIGAQSLSMAPAQRALLVVDPNDVFTPVFYPLALISKGWLSPAPTATDPIFSAMITNVTSGRLEVQNALSAAAQALDAALAQQ